MALDILSSINLDMKKPNTIVVYANQYDNAGRVKAQLLNSGEKWYVPQNAKAIVSFKKSDNIGGFYDVSESGENAVAYDNDRSIIYIILDEQITTTVGMVRIQVSFYELEKRLTSFNFYLEVMQGTFQGRELASNSVFRILKKEMSEIITDATTPQVMEKWLNKNIRQEIGYVIDDTLTVPGAASDAKATGQMVTISDVMPDVTANKVWIKDTSVDILIPTVEEIEFLKESTRNINTSAIGFYTIDGNGRIMRAGNEKNFGLSEAILVDGNETYTISLHKVTTNNERYPTMYVSYYDSNLSFLKTEYAGYINSDWAITITTPANVAYIHIYFYNSSGFIIGDESAIQIELGTEKTNYIEPYIVKGYSELDKRINDLETGATIKYNVITPEMFGAVHDGITDDSLAIQNAIDSGAKLLLMIGDYATSSTLRIDNRQINIIHVGTINYTGNESAIRLSRLNNKCDLKFGGIYAPNGNGIELYASTYSKSNRQRVQYVNIEFRLIAAKSKCIFLNLDVNSGIEDITSVGWINEVVISNGQFGGGEYGIYGDAKGYQKMNNIKLYNVSIEGVTTGIYMANNCYRWSFMNMRYAEGFTTLMRTVGKVIDFAFYGAQTCAKSKFKLSNETYGSINIPNYSDGPSTGDLLCFGKVVNAGVIDEPHNSITKRFYLSTITFDDTNKTLIEYSGIQSGEGTYFVILYSEDYGNAVSIYILRIVNSAIETVIPIYEGDSALTPRLQSNGVLYKNQSITPYIVHSMSFKI